MVLRHVYEADCFIESIDKQIQLWKEQSLLRESHITSADVSFLFIQRAKVVKAKERLVAAMLEAEKAIEQHTFYWE